MDIKVDPDNVYRQSSEVVAREIEGELILVPLTAGVGDLEDELFTLNDTGKAIWRHLDGKTSLRDIALKLQETYRSDPEMMERDIQGFAVELLKRNIIELVGGQ